MPTDPFVATDLDDRPRQQQNLPSGIAYPPSGGWLGGRPGELGPGQPTGPLLGSPGPDVGFGYTLASRSRDRLRLGPHEHAVDAVAVVAEIAMKRSSLFGRAPVIADIDVAVSLLGYDGNADAAFVELRESLVHGADHEYPVRRSLVDTVPEPLLRLRAAELGPRVADWRATVRARVLAAAGGPAEAAPE